jgi:hypothetical protein
MIVTVSGDHHGQGCTCDGLLAATGLVVLGHVLMLAGMAAVMLLRPAEYAGHSASHSQ